MTEPWVLEEEEGTSPEGIPFKGMFKGMVLVLVLVCVL